MGHLKQNPTLRVAETLATSLLDEGESPKEFFKRLVKIHAGPDWYDWPELEDWQKKAAKELALELDAGWEFDEDSGTVLTDLGLGNRADAGSILFEYGRQEWLVFRNEDTAHAAAVERAASGIDEGLFNQDWLISYIDVDHLRHELHSDVDNTTRESFEEEYPDYEAKRDFFLEDGQLDEDECYTTETDEDGDETQVEIDPSEGKLARKIDSLFDDLVEAKVQRALRDPIQYLQDIFGNTDGLTQAMELGGINKHRAAEDAVQEGGPAHWLAPYDSDQTDLPSGAIAFRQN